MASYQVRQRERLLDSKTQAIVERRSKEMLGLALILMGILCALILVSYVPDDPSWLSATTQPAENWLGRFGATIASPMFIIVGYGAWGFVLAFLVWGTRFALHIGSERAAGCAIFAPIAIALGSVYASTHLPGPQWTHAFGLGGLFGDTVLGAVLSVVPLTATFGIKVLALIFAVLCVAMAIFVLGFTQAELGRIIRWSGVCLVMAYASLVTLIRRSLLLTWRIGRGGCRVLAARSARRREAAAFDYEETFDEFEVAPAMSRAPGAVEPSPRPDEAPTKSLKLRFPAMVKRRAVADEDTDDGEDGDLIDEPLGKDAPRIKAKIADAIKQRVRSTPAMQFSRREPPLEREADHIDQARTIEVDDDLDATDAPVAFESVRPAAMPDSVSQRPVVQHQPRKPVATSRQAQAEAQPQLQFDEPAQTFEQPPLSLLTNPGDITRHHLSDEALEQNARMLETVLDDYGVKGEIVSVRPGPVVTMYELEPAPGLKASRVIGLADDIARSMSALSARVSTVPGRSVIGIELPNANRERVVLREILSSRDFGDSNMKLPLALGKDIGGDPVVANLAKMPHLLIAGTTGSGKSVAINTMILSLLYRLTPDACRLIMIDPKMLELSVYDGIPHLLSPVVTDPKKAVVALKWVVGEMEERYRKMSKMGVRNIEGFNGRVEDALSRNEMFTRTVQTGFDDATGDPVFETEEFAPEKIPYIVVIVDEMADLMMVAGKEIEACIQRLAQMARASGIHLIMATQRPSVDVITGTIKANFPTRISFQVTSKVDSRTILGEQGAEQLLGMGDMLYMAGGAKITRVHGPFVSDEEVEEIVTWLKSYGPPEYVSGVADGPAEETESNIDAVLGLGGNTDGEDALYDQAVQIVLKDRKCSTSYIQRKLAIGYNKAARLVEQMEDEGLVTAANHVGKREILVPEQ
ncbi:MAG: DNA translocase FtsK 4TM domain-containing protein [Pseudomonadota bacterium]